MEDGNLDLVSDSYRKSIESAKGEHARSLELHGALGLTLLHSRRGEYENARAVLARYTTGSPKASIR